MINLKGAKVIASTETCLSDVYKKNLNNKKCIIKKCGDDWIPQAIKEIVFLSIINHPNIIKLIDFYDDGDSLCLVLPYIKSKKIVSNTEKFNIFRNLVKVVAYLHNNNIIQGDIKVENILYGINKYESNNIISNTNKNSSDSNIISNKQNKNEDSNNDKTFIIDFGSSYKFYITSEKKSSLVGTELNLPSEIRNDNHLTYDEKIDIWTSGVYLFESITECCMYDETIENLRTDALLENDDIENTNSQLKDLILRMTCEHPSMRPSAIKCLELLNEKFDTNSPENKIQFPKASYNFEHKEYIAKKCLKQCFSLSTALLSLSLSSQCEPKLAVSLASCLLEDRPLYPKNLKEVVQFLKSCKCQIYHDLQIDPNIDLDGKITIVKEIFGSEFIEIARN